VLNRFTGNYVLLLYALHFCLASVAMCINARRDWPVRVPIVYSSYCTIYQSKYLH